jgi:fatty acid desaturase
MSELGTDVEAPSWRKPAGVLAILLLIAVWAVLVVSLSGVVGGWWWPAQLLFYVATGLVWITPLKPLLRWMETGRWR